MSASQSSDPNNESRQKKKRKRDDREVTIRPNGPYESIHLIRVDWTTSLFYTRV